MSGESESLARKLTGAGEISAVVRSMKAIAASNIVEFEQAVQALEQYHRAVQLGLSASLRSANLSASTPARSPVPLIGAVIFGSDEGLVGRFNEVLWEFSGARLKSLNAKTAMTWAIGERMHGVIDGAGVSHCGARAVPGSVAAITGTVDRLLIDIDTALQRKEVTQIHVFHNRPQPAAQFQSVEERLLPLDDVWRMATASRPWVTNHRPEIIDGPSVTVPRLSREYLFVTLYRACAESLASENASRLAAMQRAEKNIDDIRIELTLRLHRSRQETIDEELFDVVAGYESLMPKHT